MSAKHPGSGSQVAQEDSMNRFPQTMREWAFLYLGAAIVGAVLLITLVVLSA